MKVVKVICAILVLAGLAMLAFAVGGYRAQAQFTADAQRAAGEVTQVTRRISSTRKGTSTYYTFSVKFRTAAGEPIEAEALEGSSSPRFAVGEKVALLHARGNPRQFKIDDFAMLWAGVVVTFIVAAVLLGAGSTAFWIAGGSGGGRRGNRSQATLPQMARAWREGRLTRDSEFQPLLVAFALVIPALLGALLAFVMFAPGVVQVIVAAILAWIAFGVARARRRAG